MENNNEAFDFAKELADKIEEKKKSFEGVYIIDIDNMRRFADVAVYLSTFAKENDGEMVFLNFDPASIHADVSIDVPIVDLPKKELAKFVDILEKVDVFGATPTASGSLRVDMSVNNVWRAVPNK